MSIFVDDHPAIDDFIARIAIYDTLFEPKDVALGTGKTIIRNIAKEPSSEFPLSITESIDGVTTFYKVENTGTKIDGYKTRYAYEIDGGMRFI